MDATVVEDHSGLDEEDRWNLKDPSKIPPSTPPPGFRPKVEPTPVEKVVESHEDSDIMRVSAGSPPQAVAFSIQRVIFTELRMPTIRAIGAGAVAQACKGIAIARGHVAVRGLDLGTAIGFDNVINDQGEEISAQTFRLFLR